MAPGSTLFTGVGKHSQMAAQMFLVSEEISTVSAQDTNVYNQKSEISISTQAVLIKRSELLHAHFIALDSQWLTPSDSFQSFYFFWGENSFLRESLQPSWEFLSTSTFILHVYVQTHYRSMRIESSGRHQGPAALRQLTGKIMTAALLHLQQQISRPKVAGLCSRRRVLRLKRAFIEPRNDLDMNTADTKPDLASCAVI